MYGHNTTQKAVVLLSVLFLGSLAFGAETWTLGKDEQWQAVSENPRARYLLEVSKLKELINQGKTDELADVIAKLKQDYPEIAGPDLDEYLEGDRAFAAGNFTKAVRAYDTFFARYPESPLYEAALERELEIAQAYLGGHKKRVLKFFKIKGYAEGVRVADKVIDRAGDTPIALRASLAVAESYEKRAKYQDAYERWSQISSRWPTGETGKTALLAMARCKHAAYRGPNFDASNLLSAKSYYENFMTRYPEEAKTYEIDKRLEQINEQLAYKEYTIAEYYERTGSDESSEMYCEMVEKQWPESTGAKRAKDIVEQIKLKEQKKEEQEKK
jgi:outer membrane protein assembly factor BamD (BamD/ComL family)